MEYTITIKHRFENGNGSANVNFENGPSITYKVVKGKNTGKWYAIGPKDVNERTKKSYSLVWYGSMEKTREIEAAVVEAFTAEEEKCPV